MNDQDEKPDQEFNEVTKEVSGSSTGMHSRTTNDVASDAKAAVNLYQQEISVEQRQGPVIEGSLTLRLDVQESPTPLLIQVDQETIIGRRDPTASDLPNIDMTPYGGYQMGISRRHAAIRLQNKKLDVLDLGSRNGTFLNGERLKPHQPVPLLDGDELRLGKIVIKIQFQR